jgi:hypothetical protein
MKRVPDSMLERRVFRAPGRRVVGWAGVVIAELVMATVIANGLENRTPSGAGAWIAVTAILLLGVTLAPTPFVMFAPSRIVVDGEGISVCNWGTERTRLAWHEISGFEVGSRWLAPAVAIAVRRHGPPVAMVGTAPVGPRRGWDARAGAAAIQPLVEYLDQRLEAAGDEQQSVPGRPR